jgi:cytochrome d ubiquinol oxidase subunit I
VLPTAEAAARVPAPTIAATLAMYLVLYALLIAAYVSVLFYLARKAGHDAGREESYVGASTPPVAKEPSNA